MTFKASGGFFSSLFVDSNARAVADDTEYVAHRSMWVAHVRSDVGKGVVRSVVLAFCEEKQFRVAYETKYDCELEHSSSQKREFLLRFGRTKTRGDHVVLGDFTCTDVGHVEPSAKTSDAPATTATTMTIIDEKTHARLAGVDNPLRSYFHMFFDELATKLATSFLLRSFDAVPLPPSVLDLHALRRARLKREQEIVATRHLPGIRWLPEQRDWRASLQVVDSVARAHTLRDEAMRLFTEFVLAENFVITQYTPSVVCELPPNDTVDQCTVRCRTALSKSNAGLVMISYEMTPPSLELAYFVRFFDSYSKMLEHNDLLQLSSMLQRRRQLRILATSVSNAKTAADVAADNEKKQKQEHAKEGEQNGDDDDDDDDEDDDGRSGADDDDDDDAYNEDVNGGGDMPDVPIAQPVVTTAGIMNSGTPLPDPARFPDEHKAMMQRAQAEAKARVSPAAVKPTTSFTIPPPKVKSPPRVAEQPRRAKGVIVEVLEGFVADDRGDQSLSDVSTDEDSEEVRAKQREQERRAQLEAEREEARRAALNKPQYRAPNMPTDARAPPSPTTHARGRRRVKPAPPAPPTEAAPSAGAVAESGGVPSVPDVAVAISSRVELAESKD